MSGVQDRVLAGSGRIGGGLGVDQKSWDVGKKAVDGVREKERSIRK